MKTFLLTMLTIPVLLMMRPGESTTLKGIVKDKVTGNPIAGAAISVKDYPGGAFTNDKGVFTLTIKSPMKNIILLVGCSEPLIAGCKGYENKEVTITDPSKLIVVELNPSPVKEEDNFC